jgi:hypothetical protein
MMQDNNSAFIADLILDWLAANVDIRPLEDLRATERRG